MIDQSLRRTGRTTNMLKEALEFAGKEKTVFIIAHNANYAKQMRNKMFDMAMFDMAFYPLSSPSMSHSKESEIVINGTSFLFVSASTNLDVLYFYGVSPVFVDHYVYEMGIKLPEVVTQYQAKIKAEYSKGDALMEF